MHPFILALMFQSAMMAGGGSQKLAQTAPVVACSAIASGDFGSLSGYIPSPTGPWHVDVSTMAVDPNSDSIMNGIGASHIHADFDGFGDGIPYTVVDSSTQPFVAWDANLYQTDSDITVAPIPPTLPIEANPGDCVSTQWDQHAIVVDKNACVVYEWWKMQKCSTNNPIWSAANGNMWNMQIDEQRPYTYTSVDAAGLSVLYGLVRYDEILRGYIDHAIRFTTTYTKCDHNDPGGNAVGAFTPPATHAACNNWGIGNIMGMRIRLKANFDISSYSPTNQIILMAMKKYGLILADNGTSLYFQGTDDPRWANTDIVNINSVPNTAFEVIQIPTPWYTTSNLPVGSPPTISTFTADSTTLTSGQCTTLRWTTSGQSYNYIDQIGFVSGTTANVCPTATTTYTLTSTNHWLTNNQDASSNYLRPTASVTITVQ